MQVQGRMSTSFATMLEISHAVCATLPNGSAGFLVLRNAVMLALLPISADTWIHASVNLHGILEISSYTPLLDRAETQAVTYSAQLAILRQHDALAPTTTAPRLLYNLDIYCPTRIARCAMGSVSESRVCGFISHPTQLDSTMHLPLFLSKANNLFPTHIEAVPATELPHEFTVTAFQQPLQQQTFSCNANYLQQSLCIHNIIYGDVPDFYIPPSSIGVVNTQKSDLAMEPMSAQQKNLPMVLDVVLSAAEKVLGRKLKGTAVLLPNYLIMSAAVQSMKQNSVMSGKGTLLIDISDAMPCQNVAHACMPTCRDRNVYGCGIGLHILF